MLCQPDSSLKITQLTVEGNLPVTKTVEQLLQDVPILATTLTTIRIEKCHIESFVYIDNILSTCVNLIDLHLEAPQPERDNPVRLELRECSDFCKDRMETPLKLQRLTIKLFWISNRVKEIVLPRCPFVKSLEIVGAYCDCGPPFCRLHAIISRCMPSLEHIHVSSGTYHAAGDKLWVSRQAYNSAKSWSFDSRQINLKTFDRLEIPPNPIPGYFLLEIESPILTSLEINIGFNGWSNADVKSALHNYLVSPAAVSLVHLRGDGATYHYARLDLGKDQNQKLWTCRLLETLHLDIRDLDILKDRDNEKSASVTRSIFGYLTQLLPRIRELRLKFNQFDFDLEGGLCLLKRLRYLESARFVFFKHGQLRERDLYWLDKYPTSPQDILRQNWIAELQDQLNLDQEALDENDPQGSSNTLKDVIECLKDDGGSSVGHHSENQGALVCLPYLESFVLEDRRKGSKLEFKDPDNSIIQLMKSIRPGCEFRITRN
ncbi:hypothetical protein BGZ80_010779 [Entomortierella chlamydospora]|uniref:Uncharacterized protein n=1 Tax=Entomortierella chlamydospora TaxID=101097 RepID=A0A9P6N2L3_9FUNG|nr:hypothetical protein BGZ80_010779 [Entomortierella chlamydospora]